MKESAEIREINDIRDRVQKLKDARTIAQGRLQELKKRRDEILDRIKDLGVDPKDLSSKILELEHEIGIEKEEIKTALAGIESKLGGH